jgi:hypothetical protein
VAALVGGGAATQAGMPLEAGSDEEVLSFCLHIFILYGESLLEEHSVVPNDIMPSYAQAILAPWAAAFSDGPDACPALGPAGDPR